MSRIYKVSFDNGLGKKEVFAIKPYLENFDSFKEEIFIRMPELKAKTLKFFYEGKCGHFGIGTKIFYCVVSEAYPRCKPKIKDFSLNL